MSSLWVAIASGVVYVLACVCMYAKGCYLECTMYNDMKYKHNSVSTVVKFRTIGFFSSLG
jgi:hypothetical protein